MAVQSKLIENGERIYHWSDAGYKLRQIETGIVYYDAVDVVPCRYTYEETDELIEETEVGDDEHADDG